MQGCDYGNTTKEEKKIKTIHRKLSSVHLTPPVLTFTFFWYIYLVIWQTFSHLAEKSTIRVLHYIYRSHQPGA